MIEDLPLQTFLDRLASGSSTPGGGSAAGVMGAMGAALVGMVCNFTVGREKYAAVDAQMREVLAAAESARARLTEAIAADVAVFDHVMAAYGLPKSSDDEKAARSAAIQEALKQATEVPLACARACVEVIRLSADAARHGNTNVVSDAGVAVMAAYAGLKSAALNVYVNVGSIEDTTFTQPRMSEIDALVAEGEASVARIFDTVRARL
ncbi:MAG: cyclodeaminase/cyclohydrolase family protein [Gammaproteobacteria bacterium]|nr:cyclodeaminase/cyclohydrolase family protein [Gammaproteobacteria bacterium]